MTNLRTINEQHKLKGKTIIKINQKNNVTYMGFIKSISDEELVISTCKEKDVFPMSFFEDEIKNFSFLD